MSQDSLISLGQVSKSYTVMNWIVPPLFICYPQGNYIWRQAFKGVIAVKGGHQGGALTLWDWCPYKKRKSLHNERKCLWGHSKMAPCTSHEQTHHEPNPPAPWSWTLQPPELCPFPPICGVPWGRPSHQHAHWPGGSKDKSSDTAPVGSLETAQLHCQLTCRISCSSICSPLQQVKALHEVQATWLHQCLPAGQ